MTLNIEYSCLIQIAVLISAAIAVIFLNKQKNPPSWMRKTIAVITGVLINWGGFSIISGVYTVSLAYIMSSILTLQNFSASEIQANLISRINPSSFSILVPTTIFSILTSILGGRASGKTARQHEVFYGFATGVVMLLINIILIFFTWQSPRFSQSPSWILSLVVSVVNIGFASLGGYLAAKQLRKEQITAAQNNEIPQVS